MLATLITAAIWVAIVFVAITIHETAHAFVADRLGDPTARISGRLSLNPLSHYDPIGTTLLFVSSFLLFLGAPVIPFGWAKPVPFDPFNLANPRRDAALISLAGPFSNIILAIVLSLLLRFVFTPFTSVFFLSRIIELLIKINVSLAIFNLIPIHPLDGGKILVGLLPEEEARQMETFLTKYGMILLFFLIFPTFSGNSIISLIISPIINFLIKILIPSGLVV